MAIFTRYSLETPENIEVDFELAGPGSRFCALMIDWCILGLFWFVLAVMAIVVMAANTLVRDLFEEGSMWVFAVLVALMFFVTTGYHVFFEMIFRGQSPGKRAMRLRVLREDGTSITLVDSLIRNLVRFADSLPAFYLLGGCLSAVHRQHKRLGDLAAGTIVVKEQTIDYRAKTDQRYATLDEQAVEVNNAELTPAEREVLKRFVARRSELEAGARYALAERIARPLYDKYGGVWEDGEAYIERLLEGKQHGD